MSDHRYFGGESLFHSGSKLYNYNTLMKKFINRASIKTGLKPCSDKFLKSNIRKNM